MQINATARNRTQTITKDLEHSLHVFVTKAHNNFALFSKNNKEVDNVYKDVRERLCLSINFVI